VVNHTWHEIISDNQSKTILENIEREEEITNWPFETNFLKMVFFVYDQFDEIN